MKYSKRQMELLKLLTKGVNNIDIAQQLNISEHTVKVHLWRLFRKMEVNNRGQAAAKYLASITTTDLEDSAAELVTWLKSLGFDTPLVARVDGAIKARLEMQA